MGEVQSETSVVSPASYCLLPILYLSSFKKLEYG